jgi:hypothetical protein
MNFAISITVIRQVAVGSYDTNGKYILPATQSIAMRASVQPLNDREIQMMPQGEWQKEMIKIYSDGYLKSSEEVGLEPADLVQYNGKTYKVLRVRDYSQIPIGIPYYRSVAALVGTAGV